MTTTSTEKFEFSGRFKSYTGIKVSCGLGSLCQVPEISQEWVLVWHVVANCVVIAFSVEIVVHAMRNMLSVYSPIKVVGYVGALVIFELSSTELHASVSSPDITDHSSVEVHIYEKNE